MSILNRASRLGLLIILSFSVISLSPAQDLSTDNFTIPAPPGQFLIGLSICLRSAPDGMVISAIQPLFGDIKGGTSLGKIEGWGRLNQTGIRCVTGYAIGSLDIRSDNSLRAIRVRFMRVNDDHLDPKDTYVSEWIGAGDRGNESSLSNPSNQWVTGISGKLNGDVVELGLLIGKHTHASAPAKPKPAVSKSNGSRRQPSVNLDEVLYKGPDISKAPVRFGKLEMDFRARQIVADELAGFARTVPNGRLRFRLLGVALLIEPDDRAATEINSLLMRGLFETEAGDSSPAWIGHFIQVAGSERLKDTKDDKELAALLDDLALSLDAKQKHAKEQLEQLGQEGIQVDWKWADSAHLAQR